MKKEEMDAIPYDKADVQDLFFGEFDASIIKEQIKRYGHLPYRTDCLSHIYITQGEVGIVLDDHEYILNGNSDKSCLLVIFPDNKALPLSYSSNAKGYFLGIHQKMLEEILFHIRENLLIPWPKVIATLRGEVPIRNFTDKDNEVLLLSLEHVRNIYARKDFGFRDVMIKLAVGEYLLELWNIILPQLSNDATLSRKVGYKEKICNDFIVMAMDNHRKYHALNYYADRLNISPQYLTHLMKSTQGMTANKIINDMILLDAKAMLKIPTKSIKEIAFELNFADQSSFGKFFKKHTGISASKFRKQS